MLETADPNLARNRLFQDCYQFLISEMLILPSMPDIVLKIRQAINNPNASSQQIARIVQMDPSITARLIQLANSPLYQGRRKAESCPEALTRLGLKTTQDVVMAFALKSVFSARSPIIKQKMQALWTHSSTVAAISAVLAHKTPGFDPDRAMLAGLIHDIGILPILTYADQQPELIADPQHLTQTVKALRSPIGSTIMEKWGFPEDFIDVIHYAEKWYHDSQQAASYSDIVMIAQLHSFFGKVEISRLPKLTDLPAYHKLVSGELDVDQSLNILDEAKEDIATILRLLG